MMPLMERLFPLCRSLTGAGVRETLDVVGRLTPLERVRVPTGTHCYDWEIPPEWNVRDAYVKNSAGERVIDFQKCNLHLVSYSIPVQRTVMSLSELSAHLYSLPEKPDAIPYRASYYHETWGFCLSERLRSSLAEDRYEVLVDTTLAPGMLDYGQGRISGQTPDEILFSTYICHPSMANDQLSGIVLLTTLMCLVGGIPRLRYSYRGVFAPETIGVIALLSRCAEELKRHVKAGYVVTCVGDDGPFTYMRSKRRASFADRAAEHAVPHVAISHRRPFLLREFDPVGSDERQYCSPGINLPVGSLMRSRHGEFEQYHTSLDDLTFVTESGLGGSLEAYLRVAQTIELNCFPRRSNPNCEPQLGRRGLYSKMVSSNIADYQVKLLNLLSFADGEHDLIAIANRLRVPIWDLVEPLESLVAADLVTLETEPFSYVAD